MERKSILRSQQGFTLIEIISVLVLIGILAAVAVPKYIDMQNDAKLKVAEATVAEVMAQVSMTSAKHLLTVGAVPTAVADLTPLGLVADSAAVGDFLVTYGAVAADGSLPVTVTGNTAEFPATIVATGTAYLPLAN